MDDLDEQIIRLLKEDGRRPFVEIGNRIGLSEAAVRRRVQRMLKEEAIKKFTIEVASPGGASAITLVSVNPSIPTAEVSARLKEIRGIDVVYEITGEYDIATFVSGSSISEVNRSVDDIRRSPGVSDTNTLIVLKASR